MSGGIQFGGLASGLDTNAIIAALLAVESRPMNALLGRKDDEQQKLTLLGTFEGLVNKLHDKVRDLQTAGNFFAHKLTLGQEGFASFTLSGSAVAGAHTLEIGSLASADRYAFAGVADPETTALGAGTISFGYGTKSYSIDVVAGSDNLNDIAASINTAAGADVTASVVNAGTASAPSYQLVIAGDSTGADFAITGLTSTVAGLTGAAHVSTASNARAIVDGLAIERSSNLFSDVLPGISFTVSRTTEVGAPLTFTVDLDPEGMQANIKGFVDAYNDVIDFVNKQNTFSLEDGPGGPLFGDRVLDTIRSSLRGVLFSPDPTVLAANPGYGSLGQIGIKLESDGKLSIDESKLTEKLTGDLDAFKDFFDRADDLTTTNVDERGVFVHLQQTLDDLLKDRTGLDGTTKIEGLFHSRKTSTERQIKDFDNEIQRQQQRLDKFEESLVRRFAALEKLMSGLQSQSSFLSGAFSSLSR